MLLNSLKFAILAIFTLHFAALCISVQCSVSRVCQKDNNIWRKLDWSRLKKIIYSYRSKFWESRWILPWLACVPWALPPDRHYPGLHATPDRLADNAAAATKTWQFIAFLSTLHLCTTICELLAKQCLPNNCYLSDMPAT